MNDAIARLMLTTAARLPMPAPQGCVAVAIRRKTENWSAVARTGPFSDSDPPPPRGLIYSLTKTFIAALVLKLAAQDRIQLDARLSDYLPAAPFADQVTIRQLLRHTSGMPDYGALPVYQSAVRAAPDRPWSPDEFIARSCSGGLAFAPDTGWLYSNIGYLLLRLAIEKICGQSLGQVLQSMIFKPHGLASMTAPTALADLKTLSPGFSSDLAPGKVPIEVRGRYHPGWVAHGVIAATAADVARFYQALFQGDVVAPSMLDEMKRSVRVPTAHPSFRSPSYGLGLMIDPDAPGGPIYGHTGEGPGYRVAAYHFESNAGEAATIAVLLNVEIGAEILAMDLAASLRDAQARM